MQTERDARRGVLWGLVGVAIFSVSLPVTRIAVAEMSPVFVASARGVLAAMLSLCALVVTKSPWLHRAQYGKVAIIALGVTLGFPLFSSMAMQQVPAGHGPLSMDCCRWRRLRWERWWCGIPCAGSSGEQRLSGAPLRLPWLPGTVGLAWASAMWRWWGPC